MDRKTEIVKSLVDANALKEFRDIFLYLTKTSVAKATHIGYGRLVRLAKDPSLLNYKETIAIAHYIGIRPQMLSELIYTQMAAKPAKKRS